MPRRRRSREDARAEILDAAEHLLIEEGPSAVTLKRVAARVGISHPGVLHHFRSAERLQHALHEHASLRIRAELLAVVTGASGPDRRQAMLDAMAALSDPRKGRLLAWLVASGVDPFPSAGEQGLGQVAAVLAKPGDHAHEVRDKILLVVLAMVGESLVGTEIRRRLGADPADAAAFRMRLLDQLLSADTPPSSPSEG